MTSALKVDVGITPELREQLEDIRVRATNMLNAQDRKVRNVEMNVRLACENAGKARTATDDLGQRFGQEMVALHKRIDVSNKLVADLAKRVVAVEERAMDNAGTMHLLRDAMESNSTGDDSTNRRIGLIVLSVLTLGSGFLLGVLSSAVAFTQ